MITKKSEVNIKAYERMFNEFHFQAMQKDTIKFNSVSEIEKCHLT